MKKPFIWIYLEDDWNSRKWPSFYSRLTLGNIPNYIFLCLYSVYINCFNDFNIVILNSKTIYKYLPDLDIKMGPESTIELNKRRQYISFCLLDRYGGIYLEPSIIVMQNLIHLYKNLNKYDFIGFSCPEDYKKCNGCKLKPSTDIMISKSNTVLVKLCKMELRKIITSYNYPSYNFNHYGDCVLWKFLGISVNRFKMNYLQLSPEYSGTRDNTNSLITVDNYLSKNNTNFKNKEKVFVVIINSKEIMQHQKYNWFLRFSFEQILKSNLWINKLFRESLNLDNKYFYEPIFNNCNYNDKNCNCIINFGRLECYKNNIYKINEYDKVKKYNMPPITNQNLINMLKNCNYFSTLPWIDVYNSSPVNN